MLAVDEQLDLIRLQYEILNVPVLSLAKSLNRDVSFLLAHIEENKWTQLWPEETHIDINDDEEESFSVVAEDYIENAKKRLIIYSLAKETLLAHKYAELELDIISKAKEALDEMVDAPHVSSIKALATLYKDMTKDFTAARNNATAKDMVGIPTVVVKDLSGQRP